jgi:iron(III) transport system substrate-binding protein
MNREGHAQLFGGLILEATAPGTVRQVGELTVLRWLEVVTMHSVVQSVRCAFIILVGFALLSCGKGGGDTREVVVYSSVDQVFAEPVLRQFEAQSKVRVRAVFDTEETKSTGVLNRIIAEAKQPQADVFWSGDPMRPYQLIRRGMVEPYVAKSAIGLPVHAKGSEWTGIAARARVLLVNTQRVPDNSPTSIRDLADPRWKDQATIANPLFGTTTMHVAALFALWGDTEAKRFLDSVKANGVRVAASNGEVKRLVSAGEVAWGLTDTDDANDALTSGAPVRIVFPDQDQLGALVMPTSVVIIRGARHTQAARDVVDYLASAETEKYLAEHGAHLPLQPGVEPPWSLSPPANLRAMSVDYGELAITIERIQPWLREWAGL